jgi:hypothetical protein
MSNPLENFYRTKEIYVKLPTQGKWYKNPPKLSVNNEIGVMPMTIKDEIILKIPDSLYNSEAIFLVLKSIVPDIDNPYEITIPDVDVILIASRAVTQGNDLGIAVKCPNCKEIHEYSINIPMMLSNLKHIKDDTEIEIKGLVLKLKPNTLATMTANSMQKVEIAKMKSMVTQSDENSDYSKVKLLMEESLQKMTAASLAVIADQISSVKMPDGTIITNFKHILEWIQNLDKRSVDIISENAKHLNDNGIQKIHKFTCGNENCNHEFETTIEFNPTFFFTRN